MNVLIIGSGGREHAIAWKVSKSPLLGRLFISPGNPGTAGLGENIQATTGDQGFNSLIEFTRDNDIHLVLIGPEVPLAAGMADSLTAVGVKVFGPSKAAAQLESSKVFAKEFMLRHGIPTGSFARFDAYEPALKYLQQSYRKYPAEPLVIKASGLAAGKGVVVPQDLAQAEKALLEIMVQKTLGSAGDEVILEQFLQGEEVSVLAFTDGFNIRSMPPAQDHKRLLDGDQGPNTGGMGAFAPAKVSSEILDWIKSEVLQRTVDGLRREGTLFTGVLYAGMILTSQGPKVLEFNCRFGDPETQVLLPLLETDLLEIAFACADGHRLGDMEIVWNPGASACVVLASSGYPGTPITGQSITGLDQTHPDVVVFHAGTKSGPGDHAGENLTGEILTAGGRVLGVTAWGSDLAEALARSYETIKSINFDGMQYRTDIGRSLSDSTASVHRNKQCPGETRQFQSAYASSGVSIDAGNRAVDLMRAQVQSTYGDEVLAGIGAFGGLFDASTIKSMQSPVLVASTDGVGTKVKLASQYEHLMTADDQHASDQPYGTQSLGYHSVGRDLVNHCINDILVQGARPLFFLDYIASSLLNPAEIARAVAGIAFACREAGCALLGGETAEMPGVYTPGSLDLAGTIVGVVEREKILPRRDLKAGDCLVGLRSSGPHTNGYTLIRKIFANVSLASVFPELSASSVGSVSVVGATNNLAESLLAVHRSYLPLLLPLLNAPAPVVKALVHLTGGSFIDNIPRVLPEGLGAVIHSGAWAVPALFSLIQERGEVSREEMYHVFNMGIGMIVIVAPEHVSSLQAAIPEQTYLIGELVPVEQVPGERAVTIS